MALKIIRVDKNKFEQYIEQLFEIYEEAFTSTPYEQFLDLEAEKDFCRGLFDLGGYGLLAFDNDKLAGFLLAAPSTYDFRMPASLKEKYDISRCPNCDTRYV